MDNLPSIDFNNNITEKEWQEWYHNTLVEQAKTDSYIADILKIAEIIIEKREYSTLVPVLKNYDYYVKLATGSTKLDRPFWCYGFGLRNLKEE